MRKGYVMKKLLLVVATLLVLAVSGCAPQVDVEADAAIRRLTTDDWCKAEADRDIEAKLKLFTTDAVLMPPAE